MALPVILATAARAAAPFAAPLGQAAFQGAKIGATAAATMIGFKLAMKVGDAPDAIARKLRARKARREQAERDFDAIVIDAQAEELARLRGEVEYRFWVAPSCWTNPGAYTSQPAAQAA
jgi:hypothetical protein